MRRHTSTACEVGVGNELGVQGKRCHGNFDKWTDKLEACMGCMEQLIQLLQSCCR